MTTLSQDIPAPAAFHARSFLPESALALGILFVFVAWVHADPAGMHVWLGEDGPIEWASSAFFGLASLGFLVAARRSDFLRTKTTGPRYLMILAWAALMFVFMGEEISWGQRLFDLKTPEALNRINGQGEINIHNIGWVDTFLGGKYRYLSLMMWTTGLFLPLFAATGYGRRVIQWWGFPVAPAGYAFVFVGAWAYAKIYHGVTLHSNDSDEVREFLMACGMLLFAAHGAIRPCVLFRACR